MTDKPIIIDDVDVSECPHIEYGHMWWDVAGCEHNSENVCALSFDKNADFEEDFLCQDNPNCYYKQLQRKEQECEKWQAELADKASELQNIEGKIKPLMKRPDDLDCYDLEWIVCAFADEFNQLKAKNEELKKTVDDLLHKPEIQDKILWKIDNEALLGSKDAYIYKLEQTLADIKEIAGVGLVDGLQPEEYSSYLKILQAQILQKCEVID